MVRTEGQRRKAKSHNARAARLCAAGVGIAALLTGCTAESTRVAIETQRRADEVQQAVFERQHEGLVLLLFRDLSGKLERCRTDDERAAALNAAWNERDLIEFWAIQNERSRALRLIGVDAKLYSDQSIVDLLIRSIQAKAQRAEQGLAAVAGHAAGEVAADQLKVRK